MRWFRRSLLLCLIITIVTPAPAQAWFVWLDRLSGPGRWYGLKVDVRALCFGTEFAPTSARRPMIEINNALLTGSPSEVATAVSELRATLAQLRKINAVLNLVSPDQLDGVEKEFMRLLPGRQSLMAEVAEFRNQPQLVSAFLQDVNHLQERTERALIAIASPGIFISLCPSNKLRSFAFEIGLTGQGTPGTDRYANDHPIWMSTATAGLSYRIPLPVNRDFIDLGTNVGAYRFYSRGFRDFSGLTIEPFVDLHLPTRLQLDGSKWERFFGRFTVRGGLQFFPGGFKAEQFAARPGTPDISGREASASVTIFFRMNQ